MFRLPLQVAFLTGQSDPDGAALSPAQERFLDALPVPASAKVRVNFPYPEWTPPHRKMPLLRASWNNARQYLASRRPEFGERHRPAVRALLARAEHTLFLAGSCGLELLANLGLAESELAGVHVFGYGAVARRLPACEVRRVSARWDWVEVLGVRGRLGPPDARVAGGHLGYLSDPEVLALCSRFLAELSLRADGLAGPKVGGAEVSAGRSGVEAAKGSEVSPGAPSAAPIAPLAESARELP